MGDELSFCYIVNICPMLTPKRYDALDVSGKTLCLRLTEIGQLVHQIFTFAARQSFKQ